MRGEGKLDGENGLGLTTWVPFPRASRWLALAGDDTGIKLIS